MLLYKYSVNYAFLCEYIFLFQLKIAVRLSLLIVYIYKKKNIPIHNNLNNLVQYFILNFGFDGTLGYNTACVRE